jgi:hypothetical protein
VHRSNDYNDDNHNDGIGRTPSTSSGRHKFGAPTSSIIPSSFPHTSVHMDNGRRISTRSTIATPPRPSMSSRHVTEEKTPSHRRLSDVIPSTFAAAAAAAVSPPPNGGGGGAGAGNSWSPAFPSIEGREHKGDSKRNGPNSNDNDEYTTVTKSKPRASVAQLRPIDAMSPLRPSPPSRAKATVASSAASPSRQKWSCPTCTFANAATRSSCGMCASKR